jgi:hypothetical protein
VNNVAEETSAHGRDIPLDAAPDLDRDATVSALRSIAATSPGTGLQFYIAESFGGWLPVYPTFTPELERIAKTRSASLDCLLVLLLSADEDDLYCMFFRAGKQRPWFKIAAGRSRRGKEREKLASKLEVLNEVCDAKRRARLVSALADSTDVICSSDLLRAFCEITGIRNASTSFDYLPRGEREGLEPGAAPTLVPA